MFEQKHFMKRGERFLPKIMSYLVVSFIKMRHVFCMGYEIQR